MRGGGGGRSRPPRTTSAGRTARAPRRLHAEAASHDETDWRQIAALYRVLHGLRPTPVVALNTAVAIAMADGPSAGLRILEDLADDLAGFHLFEAARAELLLRDGQALAAVDAFDRAVEAVDNRRERDHLRRRRAAALDSVVADAPS